MNEEIMQDVKEQLAGALDYDQAAKGVLSQKKGAGLYLETDGSRI